MATAAETGPPLKRTYAQVVAGKPTQAGVGRLVKAGGRPAEVADGKPEIQILAQACPSPQATKGKPTRVVAGGPTQVSVVEPRVQNLATACPFPGCQHTCVSDKEALTHAGEAHGFWDKADKPVYRCEAMMCGKPFNSIEELQAHANKCHKFVLAIAGNVPCSGCGNQTRGKEGETHRCVGCPGLKLIDAGSTAPLQDGTMVVNVCGYLAGSKFLECEGNLKAFMSVNRIKRSGKATDIQATALWLVEQVKYLIQHRTLANSHPGKNLAGKEMLEGFDNLVKAELEGEGFDLKRYMDRWNAEGPNADFIQLQA